MDLRLSDDQRAVHEVFATFFANESSPEHVRAAEPSGFDPACWARLGELGAVTMGVSPASGGGGATLLDLALAVEPAGAKVAAVPIVEAMVAARALEAAGDAGAPVLARVADEGAVVVFAPRPAVDGTATLVAGGAVADAVVALDGDQLVVARAGGDSPANLAVQPLADCDLTVDRLVLADGDAARAAFATALDEWRLLSASFAAGLARQALTIGVEYVTEREQFGVPIGTFQSIAHRLADVATAVDGAELLSRKAVWAAQTGHRDASALAAMASSFCTTTAFDAAAWSLHCHGGYGFMLEYDITLLLRRAKALQLALGDPRAALATVADRLWGSSGASHAADPVRTPSTPRPGAPTGSLDFELGTASDDFRAEVRAFLDEHLTPDIAERARATGTMHDWGLHRKLAERGWLSASWPVEFGGQGRDPLQMLALSEELYLRGAPIDGMGIAAMVAHTLVHVGTDQQKQEILPGIISGETMLCLGYSEPDAGSDVAAVATRAVRDGDEWVITGQKMFTTMAHEAHHVFLMCRSNLDVPKHKGLTMFLVPMDAPGIEITPVETLGGERTNITFYTDVRVPDSARVGEVDGGWAVMMTALVFERNAANWGESVRLLDTAVEWASEASPRDGARPIDDPINRERLARHAVGNEVARLLGYRAAWLAALGEMPAVEGSMAKLWTSETFQAAATELLDMLGEQGQLAHGTGAPADGLLEHAFRHSQVTTIYGGSSEIQRDIIAGRGLKLPRSR